MGRGAGTGAGGSGGEKQAWPLKAEGMRTDFIHSAEREPHIVRYVAY